MSYWRRLPRWFLFIGCFTAIGLGVFHFVRYSPRCTIEGDLVATALSPDGSRLLTSTLFDNERNHPSWVRQRPQVWDTRSGDILLERGDGTESCLFQRFPDERLLVQSSSGSVSVLNWHTGEERVLDLPKNLYIPYLSSGGRGFWGVDKETFYFDILRNEKISSAGVRLYLSDDDHVLVSRDSKEFTVRDLENGTVRGVFKPATTYGDCKLCPRGTWLVEPDPEFVSAQMFGAPGPNRIFLWDLTTLQRVLAFESPKQMRIRNSEDGRFLAILPHFNEGEFDLQMIDISTGKIVWTHTVYDNADCVFAPDNSTCAVYYGYRNTEGRLIVLDVNTGKVLWEKEARVVPFYVDAATLVLIADSTNGPP